MNRTELEKLEWMKDTTDGVVGDKACLYDAYLCWCTMSLALFGQDSTVRFGIDGSLIPRHSDLPVSLGLHHHGDDPQVRDMNILEKR